jgi:predicted alpha/beta hydrolase family esterase
MPDPDKPAYAPWKERLEKELAALEDEAIVVGHSLGGSVVLKVLSETKHTSPIAGIFLVATPFWGGSGEVEEFALRKDFAARLPKTPRVFLYHSRDDDVVPFAHLALYGEALPRATVRELDGYGHLFKKRCRELVADIRTL